MIDGTFTFFAIQHRCTHESPWLEPEVRPLTKKKVTEDDWAFGWDSFCSAYEPWEGRGNDRKPKYRAAYNQSHDVWAKTGRHGWWSLRFAALALQRARVASEEGRFDSEHMGKKTCALRYEFRIVKITVSKETFLVSQDDLIDALTKDAA